MNYQNQSDVVVLGAGIAGLSAALTLVQKGKKVVLLEKMSEIGGASAMAGGGSLVINSRYQSSFQKQDEAIKLKEAIMEYGHYLSHEPTVDLFVNYVGESFDWLTDKNGGNVEYHISENGKNFGAKGRGIQVVTTLANRFIELGGQLVKNAEVKQLIIEKECVVGVLYQQDNKSVALYSPSVILASGGYGNNKAFIQEHITRFVYAGAKGACGEAIELTKALNAKCINMEYVNVQPNSIVMPSGLGQFANPGVNHAYRTSGAFLINQDGKRFINEMGNTWDLVQAMKGNRSTYLLMDEKAFNAFNQGMFNMQIYQEKDVEEWLNNHGKSNPVMIKANSIESMQAYLSLKNTLEKTIEKYNEGVRLAQDEYGREILYPLNTKEPIYLIQMWLRYYASLGGLQVNQQFQVVNEDDLPIKGLYAAGEVIGGLCGDIYYPGSLLSWAFTSGHMVAKYL